MDPLAERMILDEVQKLSNKVDTLSSNVTEAITRLDHPDPQMCTQQEHIAQLEKNQDEIFERLKTIETSSARLHGMCTVVGTILTLGLSCLISKIYEAIHHIKILKH